MSILSFFWRRSADNPGIYQIRNKKTGTVYIGSSVHITRRWKQHRESLDRGIHSNSMLQQDWECFGKRAFEFSVIEVVADEKMLTDREHYWTIQMQKVVPCYNIRVAGLGNRRYRNKLFREYGSWAPADFDMTNPCPTLSELTRFLSLNLLVTGEWLWTAEEIAHFLRGQELSEDEIISLVQHYREGFKSIPPTPASVPRPKGGWR